MNFVIPLRKEDLLNASTCAGQYRVEELLTVREVTRKWDECKTALDEQGATFILEYFDALYSCLTHGNGLDAKYHQDTLDILKKGLSFLINDLNVVLDEDEDLDNETKSRSLTALKMLCYLLCQAMHKFESDAAIPVPQLTGATGKGRKKGKPVHNNRDDQWSWDAEKSDVIRLLQQLFVLPVQRLWTPPIIEDEFLNLISNGCFKFLENVAINRAKDLRDNIFQLLGNVLKMQKHGIGCAVKIVQLLQLFEHLAIPLAHGVILFAQEYGLKNVLNDVIREIGSSDAQDLAADSVATRAFSTFLVEVAQNVPDLILTNISMLATHLDGDSYGMRNCVLGIMSEIVVRAFGRPGAEDKSRDMRDQFLDHLEEHVHDVNAFVRSRVLQIWAKLSQERVIPLRRQRSVLRLVIGRLTDKACSVRKYAIQLLTAFLQGNPYASKLSLDDLTETLKKEKEKLAELTGDTLPKSPEPPKVWDDIENELRRHVTSAMNKENGDEEVAISNLLRSELLQSMIAALISYDHEKAALLAVALHKQLKAPIDDEDPIGDVSEIEESPLAANVEEEILEALKTMYLENCSAQRPASAQEDDSIDSSDSIILPVADTNAAQPTEADKQRVVVQYYKDTIQFAKLVSEALPLVSQLLGSSQNTDVLEAIQFFVTAHQFGVADAIWGVRKMLPLIWSKEAGIKTAVIAAYKSLYLSGDKDKKLGRKQESESIVKNLTVLTKDGSVGDLESLEELICEFVSGGDIGDDVVEVLWEHFANRNGLFSEEDSNAAVILLSMAGRAKSQMIENNLQALVSIGLGTRAENNFKFARDVCCALLKLVSSPKVAAKTNVVPLRFPPDHMIFEKIVELVVQGMENVQDRMWVPMTEQAVAVIYQLAEHPDRICESIIGRMSQIIMEPSANADEESDTDTECDSTVMSRFLFLCGHIALCQMTHLDVNIFSEMKRRNQVEEDKATKAKEERSKKKKNHRRSFSATASIAKGRESLGEIDEDCGLTGATADDIEAEYIHNICDKELVVGKNLLARLSGIIVTVATNPGKYPDPDLQASASLALAKYMMVSPVFCESHMQLLITILERSPEPTIRANTIVALGDLARRFPNVVEPWTRHLYGRLKDDSFEVQYAALIILTHLILHDLVKVKGQISEMALCVVNPNERIAGMAKLFFQELSRKGNAIYNLLPDIISRLSDNEVGTTEDTFQAVLKYLLPFVQKDKLLENLVEKLCQRFNCTRLERQWRDLAFCISLLCLNDRCYRKLLDNLACYGDKLMEPQVYEYFSNIIATAKKSAKTENKALLDELEEKFEQFHKKGVEDEGTYNKASQATKGFTRPSSAVKAKKVIKGTDANTESNVRSSRSRTRLELVDEAEPDDEASTEMGKTANKRVIKNGASNKTPRSVTKKKPAPLVFSSDEDDDNVVDEPARRATRSTSKY